MTCPILKCVFPVDGPLRICKEHYKLVPRPQQEALAHYARTRKGGPAHKAAFERACETIIKAIQGRQPVHHAPAPAALPYKDE